MQNLISNSASIKTTNSRLINTLQYGLLRNIQVLQSFTAATLFCSPKTAAPIAMFQLWELPPPTTTSSGYFQHPAIWTLENVSKAVLLDQPIYI
nr:hypothetical protein Iba_chr05eCG1550 [Ipomoea batatas]